MYDASGRKRGEARICWHEECIGAGDDLALHTDSFLPCYKAFFGNFDGIEIRIYIYRVIRRGLECSIEIYLCCDRIGCSREEASGFEGVFTEVKSIPSSIGNHEKRDT